MWFGTENSNGKESGPSCTLFGQKRFDDVLLVHCSLPLKNRQNTAQRVFRLSGVSSGWKITASRSANGRRPIDERATSLNGRFGRATDKAAGEATRFGCRRVNHRPSRRFFRNSEHTDAVGWRLSEIEWPIVVRSTAAKTTLNEQAAQRGRRLQLIDRLVSVSRTDRFARTAANRPKSQALFD